jgi:hypothetical protein
VIVDDDVEFVLVLVKEVAAKTQGEAMIAAIAAMAAMAVICAVLVFNFRRVSLG